MQDKHADWCDYTTAIQELRQLRDQLLASSQARLALAEQDVQRWRELAIASQANADQWRSLALQYAAEARDGAIALKRMEIELVLESGRHD